MLAQQQWDGDVKGSAFGSTAYGRGIIGAAWHRCGQTEESKRGKASLCVLLGTLLDLVVCASLMCLSICRLRTASALPQLVMASH